MESLVRSIRRLQGGVEDPAPVAASPFGAGRQLERQGFPVGIQHEVQPETPLHHPGHDRERVGLLAPIRLLEPHAMPLDLCLAQELVEAEAGLLGRGVPDQPEPDELLHESVEVCVPRDEGPVEPAELAVLAVGVVVAALAPPDLVPHEQHGRAQ